MGLLIGFCSAIHHLHCTIELKNRVTCVFFPSTVGRKSDDPCFHVLSVQKVFPIKRSLPARPEPDNTFWTDSTFYGRGRHDFCVSLYTSDKAFGHYSAIEKVEIASSSGLLPLIRDTGLASFGEFKPGWFITFIRVMTLT